MFETLTTRAREVIGLARQESHAFNHQYVGTEHILLGLVREESGLAADVLKTFGVTAHNVSEEIEKLVQRGPNTVFPRELPLTPRAMQAIEFAIEEARNVNDKYVCTEHLLLGLVREPDGVAGQVLRNLGLELSALKSEVLKIRLMQLKIVEKAVRPVRASTPRKRKMREELLSHLTAIYEQEQDRLNDPAAALQEAQRRFGDAAELAAELESALPSSERWAYYLERRFGWRAPESAARYLMRLATQLFFIVALTYSALTAAVGFGLQWDKGVWVAVRPAATMLLMVPAGCFVLGLLYFKMRDAQFGAFGARKSLFTALLFSTLFAIFVFALGFGFIAISQWDVTKAVKSLYPCAVAAIVTAIAALVLARLRGPTEIRDTLWACLDIGAAAPGHDQ